MIGPVVVFDIGGTLIHPDFSALREWAITKSVTDVSTATVERAFRLAIAGDVFAEPVRAIQTQAIRFFSACASPPSMKPLWNDWWSEIVDSGGVGSWLYRVLDPDAFATLLRLKELGCRLIAASNSDGTLQAELRSHGLLEFFDEVFDSHDIGFEKPDHRFFDQVLASSRSSHSVHIGDDLIKDCIAAGCAGFQRVLLYDQINLFPGLPDHIKIKHLHEVVGLLGESFPFTAFDGS